MTDATSLLQSPLGDRHRALGAKMADFGGWEMPIEYPGGGVLKEHAAVREAVGVFDVSHLGKAVVRGPGARDFVNSVLSNDLDRIGPGQAQYTLCCDDATGGVVDDLIAYLRSDDEVFLIPNAAEHRRGRPSARGRRPGRGRGPRPAHQPRRARRPGSAQHRAARAARPADARGTTCRSPPPSGRAARWWSAAPATPARPASSCCRSGPTRRALWDALLDAGADLGVRACGLGARDTLRTEMGYPLHGQDLSLEITPVQARGPAGPSAGPSPRSGARPR